jgi:hypothetical protein
VTELLRSDRLTITTDRTRKQSAAATRFYIAQGHAEPVPAAGAALVLCREIERMARKRGWGWGDVLRVQACVGELENNEQEER